MPSITEELEHIIQTQSKNGEIFIRDFISHFGGRSLIFIIAILALPIALPFTPPGINTPFALACIILTINWMLDKEDFRLPKWIEDKKLPFRPDGKFFEAMKKLLNWIEYIIKPRSIALFKSKWIKLILGFGLLASATVMIIPLPVVNSISSLLVLLIAVSIFIQDAKISLLSAIGGILLFLLSVAIVVYGFYIGQSFLQ